MSALRSADSVSQSEIEEAEKMLNDVEDRFEGEKNSEDGKMNLLADLRRTFLKMEEVEKSHEWDTLEAELRHEFDRLEKANNDLGNKHDQEVNELRRQTDAVIRSHDVKMGRKVLKMIEQVFVQVTFIYQLMGCINHYDKNFGRYAWRNSNQARQLLNQGKSMIASGNINEPQLHGICVSVLNLLPEDERNHGGGVGTK
jgi:molecular chaperone DnaK